MSHSVVLCCPGLTCGAKEGSLNVLVDVERAGDSECNELNGQIILLVLFE